MRTAVLAIAVSVIPALFESECVKFNHLICVKFNHLIGQCCTTACTHRSKLTKTATRRVLGIGGGQGETLVLSTVVGQGRIGMNSRHPTSETTTAAMRNYAVQQLYAYA